MKNYLIGTFAFLTFGFSVSAQETVSSSEGKKIYAGISGAFVNANNEDNWGGGLNAEYFVNSKISLEGGYLYSTSTVKINSEFNKVPAGNVSSKPETETAYNHNHYFNLAMRYYILDGSGSLPLGIYGGVGVGFGIFRSTEYANPSDPLKAAAYTTPLQVSRVFYLPLSIGADYALGPGKVFAQITVAPKLFNIGSNPDKEAYEALYQAQIGYKIGF